MVMYQVFVFFERMFFLPLHFKFDHDVDSCNQLQMYLLSCGNQPSIFSGPFSFCSEIRKQSAFTCSKLLIEILEQDVKYGQS